MKSGVTVIICCYNSEKRLPETLAHLSKQVTVHPWEIVLVDNGSTDQTAAFAEQFWLDTASAVPLRVVKELRPGLGFARERGIANAEFDVVVFCDDDNHLNEAFVESAHQIFQDKQIGIAGGPAQAVFESAPPAWFTPFLHMLALGEQAQHEGDITMTPGIVFGAGMVLRRDAFVRIKDAGFQPQLSDRKKNTLTSGGDTELCFAFRLAGYKIWYSKKLALKHYMTSPRLNWEYIRRLKYFMGRSSIYLVAYYEYLLPNNLNLPRGYKKSWWYQAAFTCKELLVRMPSFVMYKMKNDRAGYIEFFFLVGRLHETLLRRDALYAGHSQVTHFLTQLKK